MFNDIGLKVSKLQIILFELCVCPQTSVEANVDETNQLNCRKLSLLCCEPLTWIMFTLFDVAQNKDDWNWLALELTVICTHKTDSLLVASSAHIFKDKKK